MVRMMIVGLGTIALCQAAMAMPKIHPRQLQLLLHGEYRADPAKRGPPVMIWGAPGIGKSDIVLQVARKNRGGLVDLRLSQMEPTDLRGIPFVPVAHVKDKDKNNEIWTVWAPPDVLPRIGRDKKHGILFLDEINSAPPTVSAAAFQLLLGGKLGEYKLPRDWIVVGAGNREGDHGLTYEMLRPLVGRMQHWELRPDLEQWVEWAHRNEIHPGIIAYLRYNPEKLLQIEDFKANEPYYSPRGWAFASRSLTNHPELQPKATQACIGDVAGQELHAFLEREKELPDLGAVIEGRGQKVQVPGELDLQYYATSALVSRGVYAANKAPKQAAKIYDRILEYIGRFPEEEVRLKTAADLLNTVGPQQLLKVPQFAPFTEQLGDQIAELQKIMSEGDAP